MPLDRLDLCEESPRDSARKLAQTCGAIRLTQGCCAVRGSFGVFHRTVISRFAHGALTGRKPFPPSYFAPDREGKFLSIYVHRQNFVEKTKFIPFHRTRRDKIPQWRHLKSCRRTAPATKPPRVRNKPSVSRPCGHADKNRLTLSGVLVSKRSTCKVAHFFFVLFLLWKEKGHRSPFQRVFVKFLWKNFAANYRYSSAMRIMRISGFSGDLRMVTLQKRSGR